MTTPNTAARETLDQACSHATAALAALAVLQADENETTAFLERVAGEIGASFEGLTPDHAREIDRFVAQPIATVCVRALFRKLSPPDSYRKAAIVEGLLADGVQHVAERTGLTSADARTALRMTGTALLDGGFFDRGREILVGGRTLQVLTRDDMVHVTAASEPTKRDRDSKAPPASLKELTK